jgi:hypothetical protein
MVFFIPWRVVAEDSGAAHLDLLGSPGWCSGCWPHDGEGAGGADSFFVISGSGPTMELGAIGATDAAAAVELPGHRRQHPGSTTALSGRDGTRADGVLDRGRRRLFPF